MLRPTTPANKTIQVWTTAEAGVYCARVMYLGKFVAVSGASPQGGGALAGGEKGSFEGGYWATITGTLLATPAWQTNGHVGAINFRCDASTGKCTNGISWTDEYFAAGTLDRPSPTVMPVRALQCHGLASLLKQT